MKIAALVVLGAVQAAITIKNTGNRVRLGSISDKFPSDGERYGLSGDLMTASLMSALSYGVFGQQGKREDTWFYYQSAFENDWHRVVYTPHSMAPNNPNSYLLAEDGTKGHNLMYCNAAIRRLYEAQGGVKENIFNYPANDTENIDAIKAECEEMCVLFATGTDYFDAKNCDDPQGSLAMGVLGATHPWIEALRAFSATIEEKTGNWFDSFVPPHVVGSKIYPELANGEEQDVDASLVVTHNITVSHMQSALCRHLRTFGTDVACEDDELDSKLNCAMTNYIKLSEDNSNFPQIDMNAWAEGSHYSSSDHGSDWDSYGWGWSSSSSWDAYWWKKKRTLAEKGNERFLSDSSEISGLG